MRRDDDANNQQGTQSGFNPHACMRRDLAWSYQPWCLPDVSIHTPAWGVTLDNSEAKHPQLVSIHTPAWGVTSNYQVAFIFPRCFNPHACMRRDLILYTAYQSLACFNPHACMRRDQLKVMLTLHIHLFQSTRLHEAWLSNRLRIYQVCIVSIHTPAWGVT